MYWCSNTCWFAFCIKVKFLNSWTHDFCNSKDLHSESTCLTSWKAYTDILNKLQWERFYLYTIVIQIPFYEKLKLPPASSCMLNQPWFHFNTKYRNINLQNGFRYNTMKRMFQNVNTVKIAHIILKDQFFLWIWILG